MAMTEDEFRAIFGHAPGATPDDPERERKLAALREAAAALAREREAVTARTPQSGYDRERMLEAAERARLREVARQQAEAQGWFVADAAEAAALLAEIGALRAENTRLRAYRARVREQAFRARDTLAKVRSQVESAP